MKSNYFKKFNYLFIKKLRFYNRVYKITKKTFSFIKYRKQFILFHGLIQKMMQIYNIFKLIQNKNIYKNYLICNFLRSNNNIATNLYFKLMLLWKKYWFLTLVFDKVKNNNNFSDKFIILNKNQFLFDTLTKYLFNIYVYYNFIIKTIYCNLVLFLYNRNNMKCISMPKTNKLITVLRSPHTDKKSREQFSIGSRSISYYFPFYTNVRSLIKFIGIENYSYSKLFYTVAHRIN